MIKKFAENVPGRFFTTDCCIGCDACRVSAPKHFKKLPGGYYVVAMQPTNQAELKAMLEAYSVTFNPRGPGPCIVDMEDKKNMPEDLDQSNL